MRPRHNDPFSNSTGVAVTDDSGRPHQRNPSAVGVTPWLTIAPDAITPSPLQDNEFGGSRSR